MTGIKKHKANEFYIRKVRGWYLIIDGYDESCDDLQKDKAEAERVAVQLNELRNKRFNKAPIKKGLYFFSK